MRCFIDMDGVVADFVGGVCRFMDVPRPVGPHDWDIVKVLGWEYTESQFWEKCDYDFWCGLDRTVEADVIVKLASDAVGKDNCCFLSTPSRSMGCETGKREWLRKHFPGFPVMFSVGEDTKKFCGHHEAILIDDKESNITSFVTYGGHGHLIGRPWNTHHILEDILLSRLKKSLDRFTWRTNL